ncbi:MAG: class I SAM-dependent methyltransferase [Clostridiales bacterium]|jgi:tRNA (adenine22-N1)-methyltransferase|nr:class I SAM-dependent methyltransferase [Clostridiales bacterium]
MALGTRLNAIVAAVPPDWRRVADIGCDHGLVAAALAAQGRTVIAVDLSAPCLQKTRDLAKARGLAVDTRQGYGLRPLRGGEADGAVIAGMGGRAIIDILSDPQRTDGINRFVLVPHRDRELVKQYLASVGLRFSETVAAQGKHTYLILTAAPRE